MRLRRVAWRLVQALGDEQPPTFSHAGLYGRDRETAENETSMILHQLFNRTFCGRAVSEVVTDGHTVLRAVDCVVCRHVILGLERYY